MKKENKNLKKETVTTKAVFNYVVRNVTNNQTDYRSNVSKSLNDNSYYQTRNRIDSSTLYATRGK